MATFRYTDESRTEIVVEDGNAVTTIPASHPLFKELTEGRSAIDDQPAVKPVPIETPRHLPTPAEVDVERDRRIGLGIVFGGKPYQVDDRSLVRITAMGAEAKFAMLAGKGKAGDKRWAGGPGDFGWIAADNSFVPMDAPTMAAFADAVRLFVSGHQYAARALKDRKPIPSDYRDDRYWPATS